MSNQKKLSRILSNIGDLGFRRRITTLLKYLDIKDNDLVLDCGCGEGFYAMVMSELYNCRIQAIDHDEKLLMVARKQVGERTNIRFLAGDVVKLPFKDESFDKIILSEVLEHIPDDSLALKEIYRVLKKNGVVGITVPNHNYPLFWDPLNKIRERLFHTHFSRDRGFLGGLWAMHLRLYYPAEIKKVVEKVNLKIEKIKGLTHYCLPFNHHLLYFFKQVHNKMPLPKAIYDSMDKFAWRKKKRSFLNPIPFIQKILDIVDKANDGFSDMEKTSVCIAIKAVKG